MAKKDTYLALLRRGIDETTAMQLADAGLKIGDLKKIDQTIDRLDADDYGYCDTCGIEIGLRRLEARPTATQCVDCKALDEIKERQIHG